MTNLAVNMTVTGNTSDARNEVKALGTETKKLGDTSARATEATSRGFKQLKASIDPVYRAELELERAQRLLNQAVRAGVTTQGEAVKIAAQLAAKNNVLATSMANVGRKSRISGHQLQNVSFQVGDFATQVGAGTAASVALGQQLPQLLGGFGILGAVLGAVAAIAVPLARALFSTADAAEKNIDPVERLTEAQNDARQSLQNYRNILAGTAEDIRTEYGGMTEQVMAHVEALGILSKEESFKNITDVLEQTFGTGVAGEFADDVRIAELRVSELQGRIDELSGSLGISVYQKDMLLPPMRAELERISRLPDITEKYNVSQETINSFLGLRDAINEAVSAGDFEAANEDVAALRDLLQGVPDGPLKEMIEGVLQAEALLIKAGFAAGTIAPGIDAAANSASILALNLRNAYDAASQLSNLQSDLISRETDAALRGQYADDPVALAAALAGSKFDRQNPIGRGLSEDQLATRSGLRDRELALARQEAARRLADRGSRGGGGGGSSATKAESAAVQKLIDGLKQEIDLLGELDPVSQEMIRLRGQLGDATAGETEMVRHLIEVRNEERDQLESNIAALDFMRDSFRSFLDIFRRDGDSSLTFLEKLWGSLDKIGSKLTDLALNNLTDVLFGEKGSSSGGGLGDFFGKLLGGIKFNAKGDIFDGATMFGYGNGQLGVLGESGKEGVMPLTHSFGEGVGAKLGGRETTLPVTRLNSGKLGVSLFANGGTFGGYAAPVRMTAAAANDAQPSAQLTAQGGGGGVVNHWYVSSENPRSFAESKATMARAANRLMGSLGRHS